MNIILFLLSNWILGSYLTYYALRGRTVSAWKKIEIGIISVVCGLPLFYLILIVLLFALLATIIDEVLDIIHR